MGPSKVSVLLTKSNLSTSYNTRFINGETEEQQSKYFAPKLLIKDSFIAGRLDKLVSENQISFKIVL
jgi:hypothetical protein